MASSNVRLSIVLPCYNEAIGLPSLVARYDEAGHGVPFELILVDNGSADDTPRVVAELIARYQFARTLRVEKNQGYGNGILAGLRATRGEAVCWSHADLQTDPADVFRAWDLYRQSGQPQRTMIKGRRSGRRLADRVITWGMQTTATLLLRTPMYEINAQPKLFHRDLLRALVDAPLDWSLDLYALYAAKRCGWRVVTFPVAFPPRQHGTSNWASSWKSKYRTIARSLRYLITLARQPRPQLAASEAAFLNSRAPHADRAA